MIQDAPVLKPTFKSALQAKKRLQAFSLTRPGSVPSSPKKAKLEEKAEETKKAPKKGVYHDDKAKAVIEEIEELKREEIAMLELQKKRSRSKSAERSRFKKVPKKARNYRRRSESVEKTRKSPKKVRKYPKNWREFSEMTVNFDLNKEFEVDPPAGNFDLKKQLLFENTSALISSFKMKSINREEKIVPFEYIRYTRAKPVVPYSVNFSTIKPIYLTKQTVLETLPKNLIVNIENLYSNSRKFPERNKEISKVKKSRNWYSRIWRDLETECKVLEKTVGLSFLETYTAEDEEETEVIEEEVTPKHEEVVPKQKMKKQKKTKEKKKKNKKDKAKKKEKKHKKKKGSTKKQKLVEELKKVEEKIEKRKEENDEHEGKKKDEKVKDDVKIDHPLKRKLEKAKTEENLKKKSKHEESNRKKKNKGQPETPQTEEPNQVENKDKTPDTDEYHSHWESEDEVSTSAPRTTLKPNRSWESDEELFERSCNSSKKPSESYADLQIPLNISFNRRPQQEPSVSVLDELKLLEEKKKSLDEERRQLEIEKQKILKLQEGVKLEEKKNDLHEDGPIVVKKEKTDIVDINIDSLESAVLENEYEEFIKAVSSDSSAKKRSERNSSSNSSSSWSSDSNHKKKKKKKKKRKKKNREGLLVGKGNDIFNEFDIPVPSDIPEMVPPAPVPVPSPKLLLPEPEVTKPFIFPSIVLPTKKFSLLDNSNLKLDDSDSNDAEVPPPKPEKIVVVVQEEIKLEAPPPVKEATPPPKRSATPPRKLLPKKRSRSRSRDRRRRHSPSPRRRRRSPILRHRRSPSPRRRSPLNRRRRRTPTPPSRLRKRSPTPPQLAINRRRASPINSPLDGFKKSVADSTISDDMLPQPTLEEGSSPSEAGFMKRGGVAKRVSLSPQTSPRRISLDDRINQVLGLENKEVQHEQATPYNNYPYGNMYGGQYAPPYQYTTPPPKNEYSQSYTPIMYSQPPPTIPKQVVAATKVVQVGNILQVVPNEEIPSVVIDNKSNDRCQKIVQVGNMLQIVPGVMPISEPQPVSKPPVIPTPEPVSVEQTLKQKTLERKAEREKRRQERDRRRKEKEKKRKDKEKRKQMKIKLKTENMIKRAIQLETEALANEEMEEEGNQYPQISVIVSATPTAKSILLQSGSKQKKSVQFADGVRPGEGTSPSGGEELSSPPPRKLLKEKRYKKIKIPKKSKKRKIRVKVVKKSLEEMEEEEEDNLPPPSPPPGSPPPHIFPSRVKTHTINNIHQYSMMGAAGPAYAFRAPPPQLVMGRHQAPPGAYYGQDMGMGTFQGVPNHH